MRNIKQSAAPVSQEAIILMLQKKLAATNSKVIALSLELEKRNKRQEAELTISNKELAFQNEEKEKRASELIIANKELAFQNEEKEKRASELIIANKELVFQCMEKAKLTEEYVALNEELTESLNYIQLMNVELLDAKIKAEQSDNLKSVFLANMSHEIRTPMNAIMGFSTFLLEPGLSREKLEDYVQIINTSSLQLLSVISDIIDISKIETNQISIDSELVNINLLLNELYTSYKKPVELKKLKLNCLCGSPSEPVQVTTDGNRIKQVLCNLLNNALKFTKEGEIEFGYKIVGNIVEFYVKDTGIGITAENHVMVFQRFKQVEVTDNNTYSGNGLGLSISKALVEKLGGTITVDSALGAGSTFTFTIPYVKENENADKSILKVKPSLNINWNNRTILIVEDDIYNHAYIEEVLSCKNINVVHAWDGEEAVEYVKKHEDLSLVLMDIKMPVMNGYQATRLIKQIRPKLPVIAQTAFAQSHNRKQALEAGYDNYITKPIPKNELVELIAGYLV